MTFLFEITGYRMTWRDWISTLISYTYLLLHWNRITHIWNGL